LPAATDFARDVARAGGRVGSGFLNALSELAAPLAGGPNEAPAPQAAAATAAAEPQNDSKSTLSDKTKSWCQRFMSWLSERQPTGDLDIQLSLDSLDQPHIAVSGDQAESLNSALAQDPTWLQEFRDLALDRAAEQGPGVPGAPLASSPTLHIMQRGDQHQASWSA
jgi:hypothetical protein